MDVGTWAEASTALDEVRPREMELALSRLDLISEPKELLDLLKEQGFEFESLDKIVPELALTQVAQQICLILDEEDIVAAVLNEGQTAAMAASAEQTKSIMFTMDHPYVLRLRDLTNDTALLEAATMDPAVKKISGSA